MFNVEKSRNQTTLTRLVSWHKTWDGRSVSYSLDHGSGMVGGGGIWISSWTDQPSHVMASKFCTVTKTIGSGGNVSCFKNVSLRGKDFPSLTLWLVLLLSFHCILIYKSTASFAMQTNVNQFISLLCHSLISWHDFIFCFMMQISL